jgi:hypothetical protein
MMRLSVFTPSNDPKFLADAYKSLCAQTDPDWHWTVVHNNGGEPFDCDDKRITQHLMYKAPEWVGALKAYACDKSDGDVLLELDHDDILLPTAVEEVKKAFSNPSVSLAYSNTVYSTEDFKPTHHFDEKFGWQFREFDYEGHKLEEHVSFPPDPASVSRIWYAPNHLRAFSHAAYDRAGGYAKDMRVLDDQDLMARLYQQGEFQHIDKPLYLYRVHGKNAWIKHNEEIQNNVYRLHDKYIEDIATAWATRSGFRRLELGGAMAARDGFETVDRINAQILCDLDQPWPFADSSVGVIRAYDIFEHLRDSVHTMRECYRVLAPGGWVFAQVPSTDGRGAFQDPTHKSFWNENSWLYFTHMNWARYIDTPVRFQAVRSYTTEKDSFGICWTKAHLVSLKGGYRPPGLIEI